LKLCGKQMLFIERVVEVWSLEKMKIGHDVQESGLGIKILLEEDGEYPKAGELVTVHYTGWLENGTKFDSSYDRDRPFNFNIGQGRVIKGGDEGISKLKKGSMAILLVPPELGYGNRSTGGAIPPGSTLIFKVELIDE